MTNHIVLFEPQIPVNTGSIVRTCAAMNIPLHLIEPLGPSTDDKHLKCAGLDYWNGVNIAYHKDLAAFLAHAVDEHLHLVIKFAHQIYSEANYSDGEDHYFLLEEEITGLSETFIRENEKKCIRTSMNDEHVRSLNFSNTAVLTVYEALRQRNFPNLELMYHYESDKLD